MTQLELQFWPETHGNFVRRCIIYTIQTHLPLKWFQAGDIGWKQTEGRDYPLSLQTEKGLPESQSY